MQKRRGINANHDNNDTDHNSLSVPVAASDANNATNTTITAASGTVKTGGKRTRRRRVNATTTFALDPGVGLVVLFITAGAIIFLISFFGGGHRKNTSSSSSPDRHHHSRRRHDQRNNDHHRRLLPPLYRFATLQYPLHHSKLVGLYFGASWCPMCASVTRMLEENFQTVLLPPPLDPAKPNPRQPRQSLSIVYISSDKNETEMKQYVKYNWFVVPFPSHERADLKHHFSVCSRFELAELEMERKFEIPTLILVDGETQSVLTTRGVQDLYERGDKAMDYWLDLLQKMRDMQRKY